MGDVIEMFPKESGAVFSKCGAYRYVLWRIWEPSKPLLNLLMCNPSKAAANWEESDPTVTRQIERATRLGNGGIIVTNLFALVSTDPKALFVHDDPVGPDNDGAILAAARDAGMVLCGWGNPGTLNDRGAIVMAMLLDAGIEPYCLKLTNKMQPQHPLYISYDIEPKRISA